MDCLEFRRLLGSDPHVGDPAAREHAQSCPFCAEAQARAQAFEARLAVAAAHDGDDGRAVGMQFHERFALGLEHAGAFFDKAFDVAQLAAQRAVLEQLIRSRDGHDVLGGQASQRLRRR